METVIHTIANDRRTTQEIPSTCVGLISEEVSRCELYGFEVDLTGNVVVPELCPNVQIVIRSYQWAANAPQAFEPGSIMCR